MKPLNIPRVVVGGIVAGLVFLIGEAIHILTTDTFSQALVDLGAAQTQPLQGVVTALVLFVAGILTVWTYAVMRDRYGAGPATAVRVGVAFAFFTHALPTVALWALDLFPVGAVLIHSLWGLVEVPLGLTAGAALYKEQTVEAAETVA